MLDLPYPLALSNPITDDHTLNRYHFAVLSYPE